MIILDTNIIIDHLRHDPQKKSYLDQINDKEPERLLCLSIISIQELYAGTSTRNKEAEDLLFTTISPLKILQYTFDTAKLAGEIIRDAKSSITFADAAIAASAILQNAELFTLNKKDFLHIPHLKLLDINKKMK